MSDDHGKAKPISAEPYVVGAIAEFEDSQAAIRAAERVRDAGYQRWDVYSPFPIHGIDEVMRRPTILPWFCALGAILGLSTALLLQWWTSGVNYPITVSGKPFFAFPSSVPIDFELTILFTAFAAFFSVILLGGLPRLYNPLLMNDRFRQRVTNDRPVIAIDASDPKFSRSKTMDLLRDLHPAAVEEVWAKPEPTSIPGILQLAAVILFLVALVPPILIVRKRSTLTENPRVHPVLDMDFQPKFKTQSRNDFFADKQAMRPPVAGTVARGDLRTDVHLYEGLEPGSVLAGLTPAAYQEPAASPPADGAAAPGAPAVEDKTPYAKSFPPAIVDGLKVDPDKWMKRGQERYNIYCATCHGLEGYGDGLISLRAAELEQPTWAKPLSLHDEPIQQQDVGKLFRTITHGIRKMPSYGTQIAPEDRWAIVLYLRALQRSKDASIEDVPPADQDKLQAAK